MKLHVRFLLLCSFFLSNLPLWSQDIQGETIFVLKGSITVIKFNSDILNSKLGEKDDYNLSVEEGKTIYLSSKNGVQKPRNTNLVVSEGKRNHVLAVRFIEKGEMNQTYYDFSDLKKLKKLLGTKTNNSEKQTEENTTTTKEESADNKIIQTEETKTSNDLEEKIAEEKRKQAELDAKIEQEKNRQKTEQEAKAKKVKEDADLKRLAVEEKKRKQKEAEIARLEKQRQEQADQKAKAEAAKAEQQQLASEKAEQARLNAEELKRKQKQAELDKLENDRKLTEQKKLQTEKQQALQEERKQQEALNAKLEAEKKQKLALEKQLSQEKAAREAKEAALEKVRKEKEEKENKLARERKQREEVQAKIDAEKKQKEEAERLAKEEREKFVLPPAQVDIRKKFPAINFNEPPEGQFFDGMYFGDTTAYAMASRKLLDQPENKDYANAATEMDGVKVSLCNIDFSGKASYIRFKIENNTKGYFILGATMLKMLEVETGKKFQLNPYYISSFPIIAAGESAYVMYVMKPEQNISADSFVLLSLRERQSGKKFELNFPGNLYTQALKKVQR